MSFPVIAKVLAEVPESYWQFKDIYGTITLVHELQEAGAITVLHRVKGIDYSERQGQSPVAPAVSNTTICVANHNLFEVTQVTWMDNACTEQLQHKLDDGWRILAVCPGNDARRPDYILGKK